MWKTIAVPILFAGLFGCASSGRIGDLPKTRDGVPTSLLVLIRPSHFAGSAVSYYMKLDGKEIFSIRSGEDTSITISSGEHRLTVKCAGGPTTPWEEHGGLILVPPNQAVYMEVTPDLTACAKIHALEPVEAKRLLLDSEYISASKISDR